MAHDEPIVLAVTGMTCAACAARIEKKLNRLDGVTATVNYATSKATVHIDRDHPAEPDSRPPRSPPRRISTTFVVD
jgi:cation transport ATPase